MIVGYVDADKLSAGWADGPADEDTLADLLEAAFDRVNLWAPDGDNPPAFDAAPARYRLAQTLLVKHLWARKQAGDGEGFGPDGFMVSTYPLVREAYDLIRPKQSPLKGLL